MRCLFCDFVSGKKKSHSGGYPFTVINETQNTVSFMAIDIPATEDGHFLVIPKKHFKHFGDLPKNITHELIDHVDIFAKVLRKTHQGSNILLNDGVSSGQKIMHAHFHVIPRDRRDNIKIEVWKRKKITKSEFKKLNKKIKSLIKHNTNINFK